MTLLFMDGFTDVQTCPKPEWSGGTMNRSTPGRNGDAASMANSPTYLTLPTAASTCVLGSALSWTSNMVNWGGGYLWGFRIGTTVHLCLGINSTNQLQLRLTSQSGTVLATGTTTIPLNTFNYIEVKATIATTGGTCVVRLNNQVEINYTGQTGTATGAVTSLVTGPGGYGWVFVDDMYVCDTVDATATQSRPNNDFLGDVKVAAVYPNAAGDNSGWSPGTNNYTYVKENPANTSDYVSTPAATLGTRDLYNMADLPTGATKVYGVRTGLYALKTDTGAAAIKSVFKDATGIRTSSSVGLTTSWVNYWGPMLVNKADGTTMSASDFNAAQVGMDTA